MNCGACGRACSNANTATLGCTDGLCDSTCQSGFLNLNRPVAPTPDDGCELAAHRVFVTSTAINANFGGFAGADAACQQHANTAGLGGTWMAWLSDEASTPAARFTKSLVPYVLVDGTPIAASWSALTTNMAPAVAIELDENGTNVGVSEVWTATNPDGTLTTGTSFCVDWTSNLQSDVTTVGRADLATSQWTDVFQQTCERNNVRLFCFEQ